jgi:hypothetical protein
MVSKWSLRKILDGSSSDIIWALILHLPGRTEKDHESVPESILKQECDSLDCEIMKRQRKRLERVLFLRAGDIIFYFLIS